MWLLPLGFTEARHSRSASPCVWIGIRRNYLNKYLNIWCVWMGVRCRDYGSSVHHGFGMLMWHKTPSAWQFSRLWWAHGQCACLLATTVTTLPTPRLFNCEKIYNLHSLSKRKKCQILLHERIPSRRLCILHEVIGKIMLSTLRIPPHPR